MISADKEKPKQGIRVLLKTNYDNHCPYVIGYWGCGRWEACTVNFQSSDDSNIESAFASDDVTHWEYLDDKIKDSYRSLKEAKQALEQSGLIEKLHPSEIDNVVAYMYLHDSTPENTFKLMDEYNK